MPSEEKTHNVFRRRAMPSRSSPVALLALPLTSSTDGGDDGDVGADADLVSVQTSPYRRLETREAVLEALLERDAQYDQLLTEFNAGVRSRSYYKAKSEKQAKQLQENRRRYEELEAIVDFR